MTVKKLKNNAAQVEAMIELKSHYLLLKNGAAHILEKCPLCSIENPEQNERYEMDCNNCVWVKETGLTCTGARDKAKYHKSLIMEDLRNHRTNLYGPLKPKELAKIKADMDRWVNRRIRELTCWIKKYNI